MKKGHKGNMRHHRKKKPLITGKDEKEELQHKSFKLKTPHKVKKNHREHEIDNYQRENPM